MMYTKGICHSCKKEIDMNIGQLVVYGKLVSYFSYKCPFCGEGLEGDDEGLLPEDMRRAIIQTQGVWNLLVEEPITKKAKLMSIVRHSLNLTLAETGHLAKHIPGVVACGTKAEMEWLQQKLVSEGFQASVMIQTPR